MTASAESLVQNELPSPSVVISVPSAKKDDAKAINEVNCPSKQFRKISSGRIGCNLKIGARIEV